MIRIAKIAVAAAALGVAEGYSPMANSFATRSTSRGTVSAMPLVMATDKVFLFARLTPNGTVDDRRACLEMEGMDSQQCK